MLVFLNVYNVNPKLNPFLAPFGVGMFHTGIEINGREYQYSKNAGVHMVEPKTAGVMHFQKSVEMGTYNGSYDDLESVCIGPLRKQFTRFNYDLSTRNCNHFSEALCKALTGRSIPGWVNRAARIGGFLGITGGDKSAWHSFSSTTGSNSESLNEAQNPTGSEGFNFEEVSDRSSSWARISEEMSDNDLQLSAHSQASFPRVGSPVAPRMNQKRVKHTVAKPWVPSSPRGKSRCFENLT
mmetsp:Transcript_31717/g.41925  ORF Transcript_31717/g.41925 Transcript_31717/m.41925 type:complete len:239 (+) Transcript_31717:299-1015(+)